MHNPTYKEVVNYLRNELGIDKEYIADVVANSIKNQVKQAIEARLTDSRLNTEIVAAVHRIVSDPTSSWKNTESSQEQFRKAVMAEVRKTLGTMLLKEFDVQISVKPKTA